jgi:hypothetical protein
MVSVSLLRLLQCPLLPPPAWRVLVMKVAYSKVVDVKVEVEVVEGVLPLEYYSAARRNCRRSYPVSLPMPDAITLQLPPPPPPPSLFSSSPLSHHPCAHGADKVASGITRLGRGWTLTIYRATRANSARHYNACFHLTARQRLVLFAVYC